MGMVQENTLGLLRSKTSRDFLHGVMVALGIQAIVAFIRPIPQTDADRIKEDWKNIAEDVDSSVDKFDQSQRDVRK